MGNFKRINITFTKIFIVQLQKKKLRMSDFSLEEKPGYLNEEVLREYTDVYFHCEDNSIIEGHMAIIAPLSPFCHRFFRMRKNMKVVDMFFPQIRRSVVESSLKLLYQKHVNVQKCDVKRVSSFLNMLQVNFKVETEVPQDLYAEMQENMIFDNHGNEGGDENVTQTKENPTKRNMESENLDIQNKTDDMIQESNVVNDSAEASATAPNELLAGPSNYNFKDHLDDWTITTTDLEKVEGTHHIIERGNGRKTYKCKICSVTSKVWFHALKHFKDKHQDLKSVADTLSYVEKQRNTLNENYHDLRMAGVDKRLLEHECSETMAKFQNLVSDLENLPQFLPLQVEKRRREFMKKLKSDISVVRIFTKNL